MTTEEPEIRKYPVWLYHEDGSWMVDVATRELVAVGRNVEEAFYNLSRAVAGTYQAVAELGDATTWVDLRPAFGDEWDDLRAVGLAPPEEHPDVQIRLMTVTRWPRRVLVGFDDNITLDWSW